MCFVFQIQEIKAASSKSKTQDMVAIRHSVNSSDQQRTTMILLCEDGSLRIYMASAEHTGYWMSPSFQPARYSNSFNKVFHAIKPFLGIDHFVLILSSVSILLLY